MFLRHYVLYHIEYLPYFKSNTNNRDRLLIVIDCVNAAIQCESKLLQT